MTERPTRGFRIVRAVLLLQLVTPALLFGCKNSVLFHPSEQPTHEAGLAQLRGTAADLLHVERSDGRTLTGFDARPAGGAETPVLLFFHGNAGNAAGRTPWLRQLVETSGLRVVLASYSGYGGNPGSPSEEDLYADALAFYDHLTATGVPDAQIVVYGESIGGGPASYVASERPCGGLILQSTLSSLSSMAWAKFWWVPLAPLLAIGDFENAERAAAATAHCPVLIVHGTNDSVIPYSEGEALAETAPRAEFMTIRGADHNDLWHVGGPAYVEAIRDRVRVWTRD